MITITTEEKRALGLNAEHLLNYEQSDRTYLMDGDALASFIALQKAAAMYGFDLRIVSAYRSFEQQQRIWHEKLAGKRPVHDDDGNLIDLAVLSLDEQVNAIIRWSAIPGLSRHHFGTDIDVFDASAMDINDVELIPAEVESEGPCAKMHDWLDARIADNTSFGFYRPFTEASDSVASERWHLSYLPKAIQKLKILNANLLGGVWQSYNVDQAPFLIQEQDRLFRHFLRTSISDQPDWVRAAFVGD